MAGVAASVERVKDRATGLDKFVLREARGSSVEVRSPSRCPAPSPPLSNSVLLDCSSEKLSALHPRFAAPTKLIPFRLLENCARLDCGWVNWAVRISEGF
jgi:hypothetical protein